MACPQNDISRGVSLTLSPWEDLNHWRLLSTMLISAMVPENGLLRDEEYDQIALLEAYQEFSACVMQ